MTFDEKYVIILQEVNHSALNKQGITRRAMLIYCFIFGFIIINEHYEVHFSILNKIQLYKFLHSEGLLAGKALTGRSPSSLQSSIISI